MKNILLYIFLICLLQLFFSCSDESDINTDNTLILIKVDYLTYNFEGYYEIPIDEFNYSNDSIPLSVDYKPPGDFGSIELTYNNSISVFNGTIVWMGLGQILYPENFQNTKNLEQISTNIELPNDLNYIELNQNNVEYGYPVDSIWESINSFEIIETYIQSTPGISVLLYTPGVGIGDPNYWDYILLMTK